MIYVKADDGKEFFVGVYGYLTQCELIDKQGVFPKCKSENVMKNGRSFEIVTGSNQALRRASHE